MRTLVKIEKTLTINVPSLGEKIKQARKLSGRTVTDLASSCEMSVQNWYRIEKEQQTLSLELLRKIEKVLDFDFDVSNQAFFDALVQDLG